MQLAAYATKPGELREVARTAQACYQPTTDEEDTLCRFWIDGTVYILRFEQQQYAEWNSGLRDAPRIILAASIIWTSMKGAYDGILYTHMSTKPIAISSLRPRD